MVGTAHLGDGGGFPLGGRLMAASLSSLSDGISGPSPRSASAPDWPACKVSIVDADDVVLELLAEGSAAGRRECSQAW